MLRDELPVTADGAVVTAHSCAHCPGQALRPYLRNQISFTVSDILDDPAVDCSRRSVQRILKEFTELGYLDRHDPSAGQANTFTTIADSGLGETSLPTVEGPPGREAGEDTHPNRSLSRVYYTGSVGVRDDDGSFVGPAPSETVILPAPEESVAGLPPG